MPRKCYAQHLGGCNKLSKEHYFTAEILREFFPNMMEVKGFRGFTSATIATLCSKILCRNHNSKLDKLDNTATRFFRLLRKISLLREPNNDHIINGYLFERWILKVFLGLLSSGQTDFNIDENQRRKLVEILFEKSEWPEGAGMHSLVPDLGSRIEIDTSLGGQLIADRFFIMRICNLYFGITFNKLQMVNFPGSVLYRHIGVTFDQNNGQKINVNFRW